VSCMPIGNSFFRGRFFNNPFCAHSV
jgi:hypothetical protein